MKKVFLLHSIKHFEKYNLIKNHSDFKFPIRIIAMSLELRIFLNNKNVQ